MQSLSQSVQQNTATNQMNEWETERVGDSTESLTDCPTWNYARQIR